MKIKQKITKKAAGAMETARKFQQAGHFQQAEDIYRRILREQPNNSAVCFSLAFVLQEKGNIEEAVTYYQKTLKLNSQFVDAYYNLGSIFQRTGRLDEAVFYYEKTFQANPRHAMAYNNMGSILQQKGRVDEAIVLYQKSLQYNPGLLSAYNNLGLAFQEKGMFEEAIKCHRKALSLNQEHAIVHFNLGVLLLMHGELEKGWEEYEWRKRMHGYRARSFTQPLWDGGDIEGRTILLYSETGYEGFGDVIQFIRYAPLISERGAKVIVECRNEIRTLLENVKGVEQVATNNGHLPAFDLHCPFMSLPFVFRTTLESIPSTTPYITVGRQLVRKWEERIQDNRSKFNIGLVWAGDLRHPRVQYRSCSIEAFQPLSELDGITLFSLQKGDAAKAAKGPAEGMKIIDYTEAVSDFADAAACMENLDLIISVDTAAAHLAGAIGKPVWTLLPFVPEWRWLLDREDSPWYPTMRIFRQPSPGDWKSVITHVADEIKRTIRDR
jgi:tetratricopeptide (TPR) repeat protein